MSEREHETVNVTPTWAGILPYIICLLENGETENARKTARHELARMAEAADRYNDARKERTR